MSVVLWKIREGTTKDGNLPIFYAVQPRRLFGHILSTGLNWGNTAFTRPLESNKFKLTPELIRKDLIEAVNELHRKGKTSTYFHSLKTFAEGTTDREYWSYQDDISYQKDALEQISKVLSSNQNYQKAISNAGSKTGLSGKGLINFIRAITIPPQNTSMVCELPFNLHPNGKINKATELQQSGKKFSWL